MCHLLMSECCCCCCCFVDNYVMMMKGYWSSLNVPYTLKDLFQILFLSGPCHSPDTLWNLLLSLSSCPIPLTPPLTVCTFIPVPRQNSSTWLVSAPRPKSKLLLQVKCSSLTMLTEATLQRLINKFASACENFGLVISLKKTNVSA